MPKNEIDSQIRQRVDAFADELADLVRRSALEAFEAALGGSVRPAGLRPGPSLGPPPRRKKKASRKAGGARRASAGAAKDPAELLAFIKTNPGLRLEEISGLLGTASASLRPAIVKLLGAGEIRAEGKARGTRYSAGGGRKAGAAAKKKAGKRRKKKSARRKTKRGASTEAASA